MPVRAFGLHGSVVDRGKGLSTEKNGRRRDMRVSEVFAMGGGYGHNRGCDRCYGGTCCGNSYYYYGGYYNDGYYCGGCYRGGCYSGRGLLGLGGY
jgi:hypothetical protein